MHKYDSSAPVTKESMLLGLTLAAAIRESRDEKTALDRICRILRHWNVPVDPHHLGVSFQTP